MVINSFSFGSLEILIYSLAIDVVKRDVVDGAVLVSAVVRVVGGCVIDVSLVDLAI